MTKIFEIPESAIDHTEIHDFKICVIGIGRIGLPTALSFAKSGLLTIGVDINEDLVKMINDGIFPLKDEPGYPEIFDKCINQKKFFATTDLQMAVSKSDVIVLSLPTPMDQNNIPNYNALKIVANDLSKFITSGKLIIIESTIEPGFIENELKQIFEKNNNLVAGVDFGLGVCPETANPGQILSDFEKLPRLIGAIDKKSHKLIKKTVC